MASHLGMSLDRVKAETSVSQFVLWMKYLDWEINAFDKECYYLAQIASEVRRSYVKDPRTVKIKDFVMEFESQEERNAKRSTHMDRAKKFFFGITGLLGSGKRPRRKKS